MSSFRRADPLRRRLDAWVGRAATIRRSRMVEQLAAFFARDQVAGILFVVLAAVVSRLLLVWIGELTLTAVQSPPNDTFSSVVELFRHWDSNWYLSIANHGYQPYPPDKPLGTSNYAFAPLYPMLIAGLRLVTDLPSAIGGFVLSNVFFIVGLCVIRRYVLLLGFDEQVARTTVLLTCFAPQSQVFSAIYTESTYLMLTAAALVFLRQNRVVAAGLAAALVGAARPNGVFIVWFMLAYLVRIFGFRVLLPPWRNAEALIPLALAPLGLMLWWWYCYATTGDGFAQTTTEIYGWGWKAGQPFANIVNFLRHGNVEQQFWSVVALAMFFASFLLLRYRLYEEFVFCLTNFMLSWSAVLASSLIRFAIVLFPIYIGIAAVTRDRPMARTLVVAGFGMLSGFIMAAWALGKWITI